MKVIIRRSAQNSRQRFYHAIFAFVVAIGACSVAIADIDCNRNNCADNGNYWIKIKRLPNIELPDWSGESNLSGDSLVGSGKQFCTIAYLEGSQRNMFTVLSSISGTTSGNSFVLKNGNASIPVTFTINSIPGRAPQDEQTYSTVNTATLNGCN
ncbi:hypothetical protein [Endozoicomonas ascidiicola]|uniref:hypothetical protein n=1 Tax=Endozoicomonas ascidiicola TaxID=1698521 RepID=UPI00082FDBCC|nr:hypothetical protein [Endozoicomonas ascidiicola]